MHHESNGQQQSASVRSTLFDVSARLWRGVLDDQITTLAGAVAFFVLLAIFPGISAAVALINRFADPTQLQTVLGSVSNLLPSVSVDFLSQQIDRISADAANQSRTGLASAALGLVILVWSANKGTKALFGALNKVHERAEERHFVHFTLVSLIFTAGGVLLFVAAATGVVFFPMVVAALGLVDQAATIFELFRWPLFFALVLGALSLAYHYGPSGEHIAWRQVVPGSVFGAALWLIGSYGLSIYFQNFATAAQLYGSLFSVIGFILWVWISAVAVLAGAELNVALRPYLRK